MVQEQQDLSGRRPYITFPFFPQIVVLLFHSVLLVDCREAVIGVIKWVINAKFDHFCGKMNLLPFSWVIIKNYSFTRHT